MGLLFFFSTAFFNTLNSKLKPYIKHYYNASAFIQAARKSKILPMDHVDLLTTSRRCDSYVGISPNEFKCLQEFEDVSRKVIFDKTRKLTEFAYDELYNDHAYFSRQFKKFTSHSPNQFRKLDIALKAKSNYKK